MSESTSPQATPTNDQASRAASKPNAKKPAKKRTNARQATGTSVQSIRARAAKSGVSVTDLARARLRSRGIKSDERLSDECKVVRGILRSNFATVRKNDASVRKAKDAANDRRPWPTTMNARTFDVVVKPKRS
jgi:hypothetical protein